jgi:hypothetical protein
MIFFFLISFSIINFCYIKIWKKFLDKVPTGIGIILIIPTIYYYEEKIYFINLVLILIFSLIYFLDDLIEINFLWRILLQIFASLAIFFSFSIQSDYILIFSNICIFVIVMNSINFQDGEDLNITILLSIIFFIFYFYSENNIIQKISEIILIFLISFSFFNIKKNNLYLGDSSCYVFSVIFFLFIYEELYNLILIKLLIAAILYPIIDLFYVVFYRIIKKENLLSRNYLHLYQIIAKKFGFKLYLLPNILFPTLNIFISQYFSLGINLIIFISVINIILLFLIRLVINKLFNYNES